LGLIRFSLVLTEPKSGVMPEILPDDARRNNPKPCPLRQPLVAWKIPLHPDTFPRSWAFWGEPGAGSQSVQLWLFWTGVDCSKIIGGAKRVDPQLKFKLNSPP